MKNKAPIPRTPTLLLGFSKTQERDLRAALEDVLAEPGEIPSIVCLGPDLAGPQAASWLASTFDGSAAYADRQPTVLVLAAGPELSLFQPWLDGDLLYYLSPELPSPTELHALLRGAARIQREGVDQPCDRTEAEAGATIGLRQPAVQQALRRLGLQNEPGDAAELLAEATREAVAADAGGCRLYDALDQSLWSRDGVGGGEPRHSASVGLTSFILRSGLPLCLERLGQDQRWDVDADPLPSMVDGGDARWLAVPVRAPGVLDSSENRVVAVLVAQRSSEKPAFRNEEQQVLEQLAIAAAPHLTALLDSAAAPDMEVPEATANLFRREALRDSLLAHENDRDPLMLSPTWTHWSYRLLVATLAAALLFSLIFEVDEYARGIAVITLGGRTDLTTITAGTAESVEVEPGDTVTAGQVLVRFHEAGELAELERIDREIELHLINRLRFPADPTPEQALISLRAQRELAIAQLEERSLRAPATGTVTDVRVRSGQYLTPGQLLLSVLHEDSTPRVVILLPGEYRPLVQVGMRARLEISGYSYAHQALDIERVSETVVGPNEARRYLSEDVADTVRAQGPVVLLEARLPSLTFQADGRTYQYHNGMLGTAEVRVRSEKILFTLVPGLKALLTPAGTPP